MKRSWILFAAAAATLALGCAKGKSGPDAGASAPGSGTPGDSLSLPLAQIGDVTVTARDVRYHMAQTTGKKDLDPYMHNPDILQVALAALVDQFVWAQEAEKQGYKLTPEDRKKMAMLESELLATHYVADVVQAKAKPTKDEVRTWYQEHQERFLSPARVAVRHILVDTEAEANRLEKLAQDGQDFSQLARRYSKDDVTRDLGGALGYVQKDSDILGVGRNNVFSDKVLSMNPGDVAVVRGAKGWHVVKVEKKEGGRSSRSTRSTATSRPSSPTSASPRCTTTPWPPRGTTPAPSSTPRTSEPSPASTTTASGLCPWPSSTPIPRDRSSSSAGWPSTSRIARTPPRRSS